MRPPVAAAFAYLSLVWGSSYLFIKIGLAYMPPLLMAGGRNAVASLTMLLVILLLRRALPKGWAGWKPPVVFGLLQGTGFALLFWGEQYIPSGQVALLIGTVPLFTIFLERVWLGQRLALGRVTAVLLGFAGVLLVALDQKEGAGFAGSGSQRLLGQVAMLGCALFYACSYIWAKKTFQAKHREANVAIQLGTSALGLLIGWSLAGPAATAAALSWPAVGSLLFLAFFASALAFLCQFYLLENVATLQASYVTLINPLVGLVLGMLFLHESVSAVSLVGAVLVLAGAWLVNRQTPAAKPLTTPAR